jgi:hypothetical protein
MPPANTERVAGGIGVDLVTLVGVEIGRRPQEAGAESYRLVVRAAGIVHV